MKNLILISSLLFSVHAHSLTKVKVSFLEALAPKDTTSSERFKTEYELAVKTAKDLTKEDIKNCGYEIVEDKNFYDASDTLQAMEKAKASENSNTWLIVGPRRSNHYMLVAKGATNTPSVSIMASAKEVFELGSKHLTLAQSNADMAKVLAEETKSIKKRNATYISIISEDCVACLDFAEGFDRSAKKAGIKKLSEIKISGDQPELAEIEKTFKKLNPDVVLLPNYSKVTAYLIGAIQKWKASTFFVGGDGWGDNKFGFVHKSPQGDGSSGLTVKGFPPAEKGLQYFDLGKQILNNPSLASKFPASGSAQALLKSMEGLKDFLCSEKPKNRQDFTNQFSKNGKRYFSSPWGVSIFKLDQGEIIYKKTVR